MWLYGIGIIVCLASVWFLFSQSQFKEKCVEEADAVLVFFEEKVDIDPMTKRGTILYFPVYQYTVNGMIYHAKAQDYLRKSPTTQLNTHCLVRYNPKKPEECLICEDNENGIAAAIASGGHLLKINTVDDVNWDNVYGRICEIENGGK